jgi:hypothetical protein
MYSRGGMNSKARITCSPEPLLFARSMAARAARAASSEPSVASSILVGKSFIFSSVPVYKTANTATITNAR